MRKIESIVAELTNEELKQAFEEVVEFRKTGVLVKGGVVRKAHTEFESVNSINFPAGSMDSFILMEIALRTIGKL